MPDAGIKVYLVCQICILRMESRRSRRVEIVDWRCMQGVILAFATSRELRSRRGVSIVCIAPESMGGRG